MEPAAVPLDIVTPLGGSGVATRVRDAVLVLDRSEMALALGKFAVVHNVQTQELTVLAGQQDAKSRRRADHGAALGEISAMALDGKRAHVAICRAAVGVSGGATVAIHSLKGSLMPPTSTRRQRGSRLKTLGFAGADRFCSVAMSTDGKLVCCQSANASWTLVVWDWSRERQVAVADVHCKVSRVRFNVIDMAQISTSGGNQLKLWTLSEYTLKSIASFKSGDETRVCHKMACYADHVWLPDDCLVALLNDGSVQLIINGELMQTVQALAAGSQAHCVVTQNNGEAGVIIGGSDGAIALLRIVTKLMQATEKEMHLQRRMTMSNAEQVFGMGVDVTGSFLVCCTDKFYGSFDLTNQGLLVGEDEILSLTQLSSTPFLSQVKTRSLSVSSRRPCFTALAKLPNGCESFFVWNQLDGHECFASQLLEAHASPTSIDIHPGGTEIVLSLNSKVIVYYLLHDTLKVAFEVPAKHVSHVAYSVSGNHLILAQSAARAIYVYRTFSRYTREPELLAIYRNVSENIENLSWSINDRSFFYSETGNAAELRHCRLLETDLSDIEESVSIHSMTKFLHVSHSCVGYASSRLQHFSHEYVLFTVEKAAPATHAVVSNRQSDPRKVNSCHLRAFLNGDLVRDALVSDGNPGLLLRSDVTAVSTGPGKTLLVGTADGLVMLLYWKQGKLNPDGMRNVFVMATRRVVDLHPSAVVGLVFSRISNTLLSSDERGVILVSSVTRCNEDDGQHNRQHRQQLVGFDVKQTFEDDGPHTELSHTFSSVCQADEIALYDRNVVELRKLRHMDIEGELQQVKLENEMLAKQLQEQKRNIEDRIKAENQKQSTHSETRERLLKSEWENRLHSSEEIHEAKITSLRHDAQMARDQYLASTGRLQSECDRLRLELSSAQHTIEDLRFGAEEQETQLREEFEKRFLDTATRTQQDRERLQSQLDDTRLQLEETLEQMNQDHFTQVSILSSNVDQEKRRATDQVSQIQGKMAALHQEVKMLLAALNQKDHELYMLQEQYRRDEGEISNLKELLKREKEHSLQLQREKHDLQNAANEQKLIRDNLQRLNNVHRSQIEILQKNLLPKERELEQMQAHLNKLHSVNQEVVIQANLSDRLRKESTARVKQNEIDVKESHDLLEHVRNSIVVLQDELGELVKRSAVQEKCAIIGEIMQIHKRITRQMDALQGRDGRIEEHLRHQAEISQKEKHKLVSALSYQNSTLMNDINALRKQNKELVRMLRHHASADTSHDTSVREAETDFVTSREDEGMDGRQVVNGQPPTLVGLERPGSATTYRGPSRSQQMTRRSSIRPKSAAPRSSKR